MQIIFAGITLSILACSKTATVRIKRIFVPFSRHHKDKRTATKQAQHVKALNVRELNHDANASFGQAGGECQSDGCS